MKELLESSIESSTCQLVFRYLGIEDSKLTITGDTGFPDRIFWLPGGKPLLIEFKRPGEGPKSKQSSVHAKLIKLGYMVEVHDNVPDAFQAVIDAVDSPQLSKRSRKILDRARSRCAVLRSRIGKNGDNTGGD